MENRRGIQLKRMYKRTLARQRVKRAGQEELARGGRGVLPGMGNPRKRLATDEGLATYYLNKPNKT